MNYPNPWDFTNADPLLKSEDGQIQVQYGNLNEVQMGAPLGGKCFIISNQYNTKIEISDWCAGPPLWNSDQFSIAVPYWEKKFLKGIVQKLMIIDFKTGTVKTLKNTFNVLQLKSFEDNIIIGVDSPRYKPVEVKIDIDEVQLTSKSIKPELILVSNYSMQHEIELSSNPNDFPKIANIITSKLGVNFTNTASGIDQKYWDLIYDNIEITLHEEHYLGVSIRTRESRDILTKFHEEIIKHWH